MKKVKNSDLTRLLTSSCQKHIRGAKCIRAEVNTIYCTVLATVHVNTNISLSEDIKRFSHAISEITLNNLSEYSRDTSIVNNEHLVTFIFACAYEVIDG